jgi:alkylation response protein AidB-like acyl-CoA dehydrogenase
MATEEPGGYRLTGSYHFGSGIDYATHVGAGFLLPPGDGSDSPPQYLFGLMPKSDVVLEGGWDVMGLESTASLDYRIDGALVDPAFTFLFAAPTRHRGGPVFDLGVIALTAIGHAGFAVGLIRRALDELAVIAKTKARMGAASFMRESEAFLLTLGTLESRYSSILSWTRETVAAIEHQVIATGQVDIVLNNRLRQATVHLTQEGADIIRQAYLTAGTSGLRRGPLERCFRDIHAGTQHFFASPASTLDLARDVMTAAPDDALDA